jgi:hypothetical protein
VGALPPQDLNGRERRRFGMHPAACRSLWLFITLLAGLLFPQALPAAEQGPMSDEEIQIIQGTCTPCHSDARILTTDPSRIRPVIEEMKAKNPALFADVETKILSMALERMLRDPEVAARRKAWDDLVAKGKALFADASLGTTGKNCLSCHQPEDLSGAAADFPKFDEKSGRYVSLLDKVNLMISSNLKGKTLPLGDPRSVALVAYLKSL